MLEELPHCGLSLGRVCGYFLHAPSPLPAPFLAYGASKESSHMPPGVKRAQGLELKSPYGQRHSTGFEIWFYLKSWAIYKNQLEQVKGLLQEWSAIPELVSNVMFSAGLGCSHTAKTLPRVLPPEWALSRKLLRATIRLLQS